MLPTSMEKTYVCNLFPFEFVLLRDDPEGGQAKYNLRRVIFEGETVVTDAATAVAELNKRNFFCSSSDKKHESHLSSLAFNSACTLSISLLSFWLFLELP